MAECRTEFPASSSAAPGAQTREVPETLNPVQTITTSVSVPQGTPRGPPHPAVPDYHPAWGILQQGHLHTLSHGSFFARSCT